MNSHISFQNNQFLKLVVFVQSKQSFYYLKKASIKGSPCSPPSACTTVCVTPSPESTTRPVVRPDAYKDRTAWIEMYNFGTLTGRTHDNSALTTETSKFMHIMQFLMQKTCMAWVHWEDLNWLPWSAVISACMPKRDNQLWMRPSRTSWVVALTRGTASCHHVGVTTVTCQRI